MHWSDMPGSAPNNPYCIVSGSYQTRNSGEVVRVDEAVLDETSGWCAFDTLPLMRGTTNLNLGESTKYPSQAYLKNHYGVTSYSYNPYELSEAENNAALNTVRNAPVDTVTSLSILNVIEHPEERKKHIALAHSALKPNGTAFFKVFRRNNTEVSSGSKPEDTECWFQANKPAVRFLDDIAAIFGKDNVCMADDDIGNTLIAKKC
ncbi:MAG: hypothetical protein Q8L78_04430 [Coxiellaceae bacterium]|nr:hypothetical protein [Coxiellaceae bacterium]